MTGWSSPPLALWSLEGTSPPWTRRENFGQAPRLRTVDGNYHEVTWMSLRRLVNLSTRGTHSGPRRVSQLGCMYSGGTPLGITRHKNNQRMVSRCMDEIIISTDAWKKETKMFHKISNAEAQLWIWAGGTLVGQERRKCLTMNNYLHNMTMNLSDANRKPPISQALTHGHTKIWFSMLNLSRHISEFHWQRILGF